MSDTKLKCPFCNEKLDNDDVLCSCINEYCEESFDMVGTEMIWQKVIDIKEELDRTRKALDVAIEGLKSANAHNIINCEAIYGIDPNKDDVNITISKALDQINEITKGNK